MSSSEYDADSFVVYDPHTGHDGSQFSRSQSRTVDRNQNRDSRSQSNIAFPDDRPRFLRAYDNSGVEPHFCEPTSGLSIELFTDWMAVLARQNNDQVMTEGLTENSWTHSLFQPRAVEYVFTLCVRLRLPQELKYLALKIFSDFVARQCSALWNYVSRLDASESAKLVQWETVFTTLIRQIPLRVVSSIQIASKICSYAHVISLSKVGLCLRSLGLAYTDDALRKSEIRVLATLDYCAKLRHTPYVYLESIFGYLVRTYAQHTRMNTVLVWEHSLVTLDCSYLCMDELSTNLFHLLHQNQNNNNGDMTLMSQRPPKERLRRLQADYMLLACGTIVCACVSVHGSVFANNLVPSLHKISGLNEKDVRTMYQAIAKTLINQRQSVAGGASSGFLPSLPCN